MKTLICLVLIVLVSSCSQKNTLTFAERDNAYFQYISDNALADTKKINSFRFDGWQSLSRKFLLISTSSTRRNLIELTHECNNLEYSQKLVLNQSTNGSLHARFDSVSGCRIEAIYPLNAEQAKEIANIGYPTNEDKKATNSDS